jgi:hypothetical protein
VTAPFPPAPKLDQRTADDVARVLVALAPAYAPGWRIGSRGAGAATAAIFGRYAQALIERVNRAPDKQRLAFLDLLGIDLLPAHAARAPLVFVPLPSAGDAQVPAGTRAGAKVAGQQEPVMFETEEPIGLAAARLAEVVTVWPGRDAYADHSSALAGGLPVTLWSPPAPVEHELFLAHDVHFALAGKSTVGIDVVLVRPGSEPLATIWEYWDGELWRAFLPFENDPVTFSKGFDGTLGLTRSGTIRLAGDCCDNTATTVNGVRAFWLRARLAAPLPREAGRVLPTVDRLLIRSTVDRRAPPGRGLIPDAAHANGVKLDLSTTFFPLGQAGPGSVLTLTSAEAFSKPGATLTLSMIRSKTPAERGDDLTAAYELDVNAAKVLMTSVIDLVRNVIIPSLTALKDGPLTKPVGVVPPPWDILTWPQIFAMWKVQLQAAEVSAGGFAAGLGAAILLIPGEMITAVGAIAGAVGSLATYFANDSLLIGLTEAAIAKALADVSKAVNDLTAALNALLAFTPESAAVALGAKQPLMMPPDVAWEYWNGERWTALLRTGATDPDGVVLRPAPGVPATLTFVVPDDWEPMTLNGVTGRFMRARLSSGGYGLLRRTSWKDTNTGLINFMPIIENRPPALDSLSLGYFYESRPVPPERCVLHGDFQWEDRSEEVMTRGDPFPPFSPVADTAPTLYLGFDGPLPADSLGVWFDIAQDDAQATGPTLRWEYADGDAWLPLQVIDETTGLAQPGIVQAVYPGLEPVPTATVIRAADRTVTVRNERSSPRFNPGDRLWIEQDGKGELVTVLDRDDDRLTLVSPLGRTYDRGTVARARLPRFGTPRTWIRARLAEPGEPPMNELRAVLPNAVWASQRRTNTREPLGSSNGQPNQVFFIREAPVLPGEVIEVRELDGARAHVECEILRRELSEAGMRDADLHAVTDSRTGRVTEVWVRWRAQRTLLFSGPDDRHYAVERTRGRVLFGDGRHGRIPPSGTDNVFAARYTAGGGPQGNLPVRALSQLLSGVAAQKVFNPRAAEGGSLGEDAGRVLTRGPGTVRHRRQAISRADFEALAREASPAVAVVRAQPTTDASGRRAAGAVVLFIVPRSGDPRPTPSLALLRDVRAFVCARMAVAARDGLVVEPPRYFPIGVEAEIAARAGREPGAVRDSVLAALAAYLHPLTGGPGGAGWPFGRGVFLSDVAALLEALDGVDYVRTLVLASEGTARGDAIPVSADRLVAAADLHVTLTAPER